MKCNVSQNKMGHLTVSFDDGKTFYLQSDYDIAQFAVDCGLVIAPKDWDGIPFNLPEKWYDEDFESITECPDDYYFRAVY